MFKAIRRIEDVQPFVAEKKEIRFLRQSNGLTIGCYLFMDSHTFDSPEAVECRGVVFDDAGEIVSRPLHKFFNLGEKEYLSLQSLLAREDFVAAYDKLDGSMIATAWADGELLWRSKKSFDSDVVKLARAFLEMPGNERISRFAHEVASSGMTAIFELTHPEARIVVAQEAPALRLLHVRDNVTGAYLLLDPDHEIHGLIAAHEIPRVERFEGLGLEAALAALEGMEGREGFVLQFRDGEMVKIKSSWYLRLHRSLALMRERDVAALALHERLDDLKGALREMGVDLAGVEAVEARVKTRLTDLLEEVEAAYENSRHLDRKDFAIANQGHHLFRAVMGLYLGQDVAPGLAEWYERTRLREDFSLAPLTDGARAEAIEG